MTSSIHPSIFVPPSHGSNSTVPGFPSGPASPLQNMAQMAALMEQFSWGAQLQAQMSVHQVGFQQLDALASSFQLHGAMAGSFSMTSAVGYAAMPDFCNAGHLEVDKKAGVVTTPGGYKVSVQDGKVRIQNPDGKWTDLKAEPPTRTVTSKNTITEQRVLPRDPAVRESDGDVWRYQGTGSFTLPDGTKITIQEKGESKDLHINQVDIYNGNKHVSVDSKLASSEWQTVKRDVQQVSATGWQTVGRGKRQTIQQRQVTQQVTEHQEAKQKFQTTFSDVKRDGYLHDAATDDGLGFRLAGKGDAWSHQGREVLSGAGKGKDDKTKAFQLGNAINNSWQGYRPVNVPWNVYATHVMTASASVYQAQWGASTPHWQGLQNTFSACQPRPYLPVMTGLSNMGGIQSPYGGPMGAAALWSNPSQAGGLSSSFDRMLSAVRDLLSIFSGLDAMQSGVQRARLGHGIAG